MKSQKTSVCVIGAGPAGSSASIFLSQYGIDHVLVDREDFPRDKFCGEAFWGRARYVLDEINGDLRAEMSQKNIIKTGIEITIKSVPSQKGITLFNPDFIRSRRTEFDFFLLEKAKSSPLTQFQKGHVVDVQNHNNCVLVKSQDFELEAQLAIVCIGEKQNLLKQWLPDYKTGGRKVVAFRRYYKEKGLDNVLVYFQKRKPYPTLLVNPLPQGMTLVEMYMYQTDFQSLGLKHDAVFKRLAADSALTKRFEEAQLLSDWQATSLILRNLQPKLSHGHILLAGSAMGAIHPMLGKGVGLAMRSGQIAAHWASQSIKKQNFTPNLLVNYDREIRRRLGPDFTNAYVEYVAERLFHMLPLLSMPPKLVGSLLKIAGLTQLKVKTAS